MPQLRKRKTTEEKVSENIGKKECKQTPAVLSRSKKKDSETSISSKRNVKEPKGSSLLKRKKNYMSSDEESPRDNSFQKKNVLEAFSSPRKDPKLFKAKVFLNSLHIEKENSYLENVLFHNSVDSGQRKQSPAVLSPSKKKVSEASISSKMNVKEPKRSSLLKRKKNYNSVDSGQHKQSPAVLSPSKKKVSETSISSKKNVKEPKRSSLLKRKKNYMSSDEESPRDNSFQKKIFSDAFSSPRKDPKLGKAKVVLNSLHIKEEDSYLENVLSHNSLDGGISSETSVDLSKIESKYILKSETAVDLSDNNRQCKNESSSSESEWEEVEDHCETSLDDYKPDIPKEGVEITIDCPDLHIRKRKKKQFDENEWIRMHINRVRKDIQLSIHKTHLLCLLAHGIYVNKILNCDSVKALALSLIPSDILSYTSGKKVDKINISGIEKIVSWFCDTFTFENDKCIFLNIFLSMVRSFKNKKSENASEYNLLFVALARILGFKVRFCVSLYPITYKASNLIKKPNSKKPKKSVPEKETQKEEKVPEKNQKEEKVPEKNQKEEKVKIKRTKKLASPKEVKVSEPRKKTSEKISRPRRSTGKNYKLSSDEGDDSDDKDFEMYDDQSDDKDFEMYDDQSDDDNVPSASKRTSISKVKSYKNPSNRKVLSSDSKPSSPEQSVLESGNIICWAEVFSKPDKQWVSVECSNKIINKPYHIEALTPKPVCYILAFDNESYVKDVTRRYCNDYMTATVKLRVDPDWWEDSLEPFLPPNSAQNKAEEKKLDEMLVNKPLPTTIQEFKNHPLYVLKRHLLKYEAIYPPDAPPVGFIRSEPVYARDCVRLLHCRETWLKEARVVRVGEEPYKIVKAKPRWDRIARVIRTDLPPMGIFGLWQTEPYEPPIAVNGKVPRNEYGNVELFKPSMLPRGTVHLQLPGINRIAKKLGIDCSPAFVGFDGLRGFARPAFDGFVICEEFKDTILAAWEEEQVNARKREEEKREKRIYGNWRKLIKGLLIRERIKLKYDVK